MIRGYKEADIPPDVHFAMRNVHAAFRKLAVCGPTAKEVMHNFKEVMHNFRINMMLNEYTRLRRIKLRLIERILKG